MGLDATGKLGNIFAAINDVRTVYDAYSSGNMSALDAATGIINPAIK